MSRFRSHSISEGVLDDDFQERLKRLTNEHREMSSLRECIEDGQGTQSTADSLLTGSNVLSTYITNRFAPISSRSTLATEIPRMSNSYTATTYNAESNKLKDDELMAKFNSRFASALTTSNSTSINTSENEQSSSSFRPHLSSALATSTSINISENDQPSSSFRTRLSSRFSPEIDKALIQNRIDNSNNSRFSTKVISPTNSKQLPGTPKIDSNTDNSYHSNEHSKAQSINSRVPSNLTSNSRQSQPTPVKFSAVGVVPTKVEFHDIAKAASRIKSGVKKTACDQSIRLSDLLGMEVFLKREYTQVTGSFKERGARNTLLLLSDEEKKRGVITASAGNHGLALAYHGNALNIPVTVFMPVNAPILKVKQCKYYNADVHLVGADIIQAKSHAMVLGDEKGMSYVNGYDHPYILAGQGTCGIEIAEQVNDIDAVVIPIGGAGLIAGCAVALKHMNPQIQIIGVESDQSASFKAAMDAGEPVRIDVEQSMTLADGLCVSKVGENAYFNAAPHIDRLVQVDEAYIAVAVLRLIENEKCVVEGAGATGLAAAFAGLLPELRGKRVVFPLCGGNIDSTVLGRVIDRGLAADGRLIRFTVVVSDRPGGLSGLINYLSDNGAGIKDVFHERAWLKTSIHTVRNKVIIEVRDYQHGEEIRHGLEELYGKHNLVWGSEAVQDINK